MQLQPVEAGKVVKQMSTAQHTHTPPQPLQKPPGYRDPTAPIRRPPYRKPVNLPPSFRQTKRRRKGCRAFCCCFCITLFVLIIFSISAGGLFYLWFQPRLPEIHLISIDFKKFKVSSTPDGGSVLNSESMTGIEIKNPNQNLRMVYDRIKVVLSAENENGDVNLGEMIVPGFIQDKNEVRNLKVGMKIKTDIMADDTSARKLKLGMRSKKLVVNVELRSRIGIQVGRGRGWGSGTAPVKVVCRGIRMSQVQNSMPECRIQILSTAGFM